MQISCRCNYTLSLNVIFCVLTMSSCTPTNKSNQYPAATFSHPEQPLPGSGRVNAQSYAERVAPLEIKAGAGGHYVVKLVDAYRKTPVMSVFVRGGSTVNVDVPLGTFEVRYASGEKWYGDEHLFGPDTSYSKADKTFTFEETANEITGYTITLYKVSQGNLRTSKINAGEF